MSAVVRGWPSLALDGLPETQATLHMWTQIVGKLRLALSPPQNHYWHSALYVSPHGLTTSSIPYGSDLFQIEFDLLSDQLEITTSWGESAAVALVPRTVADFYAETMATLRRLGIDARIRTRPVEIADPIPFEQDTVHASYDPAAARALWLSLVQADRVFKQFRGRFLGKSSPVHFFWGAFDLAVTRFSGRRAPMWTGETLNVGVHVMHESYSHEVSSAGFWPAPSGPIFYSYAVPEPPGFREAAALPSEARYDAQLGEFVLPYEAVQASDRPDELLTSFLETTYAAAADSGKWDRQFLEERPPCTCDDTRTE